jgi:hypothetical protein
MIFAVYQVYRIFHGRIEHLRDQNKSNRKAEHHELRTAEIEIYSGYQDKKPHEKMETHISLLLESMNDPFESRVDATRETLTIGMI